MSKDVLEFVVYMIHACARKWRTTPSDVYKRLTEYKCISDYLIPHYEILHTQGTGFIVEDIEEFIGTDKEAL